MKRVSLLFVAMCITLSATVAQTSVWDGSHTTWTNGTGTESNPYLIENAAQLAHLAYEVNTGWGSIDRIVGAGKYYKLTTNIDLNSLSYNYAVDVPYNVASITINATAIDLNATVSGTGLKQLVVGANPFTITVTAADGVTKLNYVVTVNCADVGIDEWKIENGEWKIYPNPTDGEVRIENGELRIENVEVYDVFGRNVGVKFPSFGGVRGGNLAHLPTGIYFIRIQTDEGMVVRKIIKQ